MNKEEYESISYKIRQGHEAKEKISEKVEKITHELCKQEYYYEYNDFYISSFTVDCDEIVLNLPQGNWTGTTLVQSERLDCKQTILVLILNSRSKRNQKSATAELGISGIYTG